MTKKILATAAAFVTLTVGFAANVADVERALGFQFLTGFAQQKQIEVAALRVVPREYHATFWSADVSLAITNPMEIPVIVTGLSYHARDAEDAALVPAQSRSGNVDLVPVLNHAIETAQPGKVFDLKTPLRIDADDLYTLTISVHERYKVPYARHALVVRLHTTKGDFDSPAMPVGLGAK